MEPTERFSSRAEHYARFRPGYPQEVVDTLEAEAGLRPGGTVADIGAGTGISSALFLRRGYAVTAVEPNAEMRAKATASLGANPGFRVLPGTAEATGLPAGSVDCVLCAQAFHWFRADEAQCEFRRILKPGGVIAVMWNLRRRDASPLMEGLEELLYRYCPTYGEHVLKDTQEAVLKVQGLGDDVRAHVYEWTDPVDRAGLVGRMLSASYVPMEGEPHRELMAGLERLVEEFGREGWVEIAYDTKLFWTR